MKIEVRENVSGKVRTVVLIGKEKFTRVQKNVYRGLDNTPVIEWRKLRTNHLVNSRKSNKLESAFKIIDKTTTPFVQIISSGTTSVSSFFKPITLTPEQDKELLAISKEIGMIEAVRTLRKMRTDLDLKNAKEYIDRLIQFEIDFHALKVINATFPREKDRDAYIAKLKELLETRSHLQVVKYIKDEKGWGLRDCKVFFDTYVK